MCQHHKLIRNLIIEIKNLQNEIQEMQWWSEQKEQGWKKKMVQIKREGEYEEREARYAKYAQEDRIRNLAKQLEEAHNYGDTYKEERLRKQLRDGYI